MFGREHDLFFFFFSALIGFAVFALTQSTLASTSIIFAALIPTAFGAGPFHQGPTWFMYFDQKNRAHYRSTLQKKVVFFLAPPLIVAGSVLGIIVCKPLLIAIWFIWSIQHLVQQNVGILLLYHNPRQPEAIVERKKEVLSLQIPSVLFTLLFVRRIMMNGQSNMAFDALIAIAALWSAILMVNYAVDLKRQVQEGKSINVPALSFWGLSVLSLAPMAFLGRDFSEAFVAPVTWHWFQYIGLNWRLLRKKYDGGTENANLPVSRPVVLFFATCLTLVLVNIGLSISSRAPGLNDFNKDMLIGALIGLVNVHYFLDAFMWRFREPYQRAAILPYLISRPGPQSTPTPTSTPSSSSSSTSSSVSMSTSVATSPPLNPPTPTPTPTPTAPNADLNPQIAPQVAP